MSLKSEPTEPTQPLLPSTIKSFANSPYTPQTTFSTYSPAQEPARPAMSKPRISHASDTTMVDIELLESPIPDSATPFAGAQVVKYGYV